MNAAVKQPFLHEHALLLAVVVSMLLHILVAVVVPNFKFELRKDTPIELSIELQKPEPPAPVVQETPEPPKPIEEPKPIKKLEPKPIPKPVKPIEQPSPIVEDTTPPESVSETPPPPAVITAAPKAESKAEFVAPPPLVEPPKDPEPSPVEVDNALGEYGSLLGRAIAKHKQYPRIAQMRGWQGDVILNLKIDGNGKVISAGVQQSSGYEALDKQALEMARKAAPFPAPPQALRNRTFNIVVPVSFKLEEG